MNWLKAKARVDRWHEEMTLVRHEMRWTTLWFQYQAKVWSERSKREDSNLPLGHKSYALKQEKIWSNFYAKAIGSFSICIPS